MYKFWKKIKGFTLIELIVAVAVIAVLAAIVAINVVKYISKSKDSAVRSEMAQLSTFGSIYSDTHTNNYAGFCDAIETQPFFIKIADFVGVDNPDLTCANGVTKWKSCCVDETHGNVSSLSWAVCTKLVTDTTSAWCVDYSGASRKIYLDDCKSNMVDANNMATCPAGN